MKLCIDSGNTRLKWGLHDGSTWHERAALAQGDIAELAELLARIEPSSVNIAHVAGPAIGQQLSALLAPWQARCHWISSTAQAGGVINGYENPAQLGVDRWCALIGARSLSTAPCLVVMCGTATTVDSLSREGRFLGGLILPGFELMRRSLARDTAALPLAQGEHLAYPRRTDDAITSGCLEAQAGAIERAYRRLSASSQETPVCLLSGGGAERLAPLLGIAYQQIDNLVLEGLRHLG